MTKKELFEKHHKDMCENCNKKDNCNGINITIIGTTKCEEGENI